jgi:maltooligosyltrehalose trehalohydrolase
MLAWYRSLLELRRTCPALTDPRLDQVSVHYDEQARWITVTRDNVVVAANLGSSPATVPGVPADASVLLSSRAGVAIPQLPPQTLVVAQTP